MATFVSLETLPVELIASVFAELDILSLRRASETCARLRAVASDALLNPWRSPILRALARRSPIELKHISVLSTIPRQNWIDILCYASPEFLLFDATLPNLSEEQYKTAFRKRFLPSWAKIWKAGSWREAFLKMLFSVYHRLTTNCTTSEAWTNFIIVNRTGVANSTTGLSRTFDPVAVFNNLKDNANLAHMDTSVRLLLRLADVRIIMFGILHRPPSLFTNPNGDLLLHPPGVSPPESPSSNDLDSDDATSASESEETDGDSIGGLDGPGPSTQMQYDPSAATSSHPQSPFFSLARRVRVQRTRSSSSPIRPSIPLTGSPTGLSFWRTLSRESGHRRTHAEGDSTGAAPGRPALISGFVNRLFTSPVPMNQDITGGVPPEAPEASSPITNGGVADDNYHGMNGILSPETRRSRQRRNASQPNPNRSIQPLQVVTSSPWPILQYPTAHPTHASYPNYTLPASSSSSSSSDSQSPGSPGSYGNDWRWFRTKYDRRIYFDENSFQLKTGGGDDMVWIGPILIVAQLYPTHGPAPDSAAAESDPHDPVTFEQHILQGQDQPTGRWASFGWPDLWAIAPWLQERITKRVEGHGLGIE